MFDLSRARLRRLATHEDAWHVHKALGLVVLAHFAWRALSPGVTILSLVPHALLHLSTFRFVLAPRRNLAYNVIWPEFRLHSLVFAYRAIAAIVVVRLGEHLGCPAAMLTILRGGVVLATMAAADLVTRTYSATSTGATTTMRDNPYPAGCPRWLASGLTTFYSLSQVFATVHVLVRPPELVFWTLLPIQVAPLGMTLVKKGIMSSSGWHLTYTCALLTNWYLGGMTAACAGQHPIGRIVAVVVLCRFVLRVNKYALWAAILVYVWHLTSAPAAQTGA